MVSVIVIVSWGRWPSGDRRECQLVTCWLWVAAWGLRGAGCGLPLGGCGLWAGGAGRAATGASVSL